MKNDVKYAFAASTVAVLQTRMADRAFTERLIETDKVLDALKLIAERGYGITPPDEKNVMEYERLLAEEETKCIEQLDRLVADSKMVDFFRVKNDAHNIKLMLKDEMLGEENRAYVNKNGTIEPDRLRVMLRDRKMESLPFEYQSAIEEALERYTKNKNPAVLDQPVDRAYFLLIKKLARQTKNRLLQRIAQFLMDTSNIKALIRNRTLSQSVALLRDTLTADKETSVDSAKWANLLHASHEQVVDFFSKSSLGSAVRAGLEAIESHNHFFVLEKTFDEHLINLLKPHRFTIDGPEPVLYWMGIKEMELRNINLIMTGKINRLPQEAIRERIRVYYA